MANKSKYTFNEVEARLDAIKFDQGSDKALLGDGTYGVLPKEYDDTNIINRISNVESTLESKVGNEDLVGLATEAFVTTKIAEAQLADGDVDLTGYATEEFVNNSLSGYAKTDDIPTIPDWVGENKPTYTADEVGALPADTKIPIVTNDLTDELKSTYDSAVTVSHTHYNSDVLSGITTDKVSEWDAKSDFDGDYNSLTNIPTGLATETFVTTKIAEAQLSDSDVDLTGYATEEFVEKSLTDYAKSSDIPTIPSWVGDEKPTYTADEVGALSSDTVIPTVTNDLTDELKVKYDNAASSSHTHDNADAISTITSEKISYWDAKSDFDGSYESLTNKPTGLATEDFVNNTISSLAIGDTNIIESITVNGVTVVPDESKNVEISVPEKYDDTKLTERVELIESELDGKADTSDIPSIDGLATTDYVDSKVAELVNSAPETLDTLGELATAISENDTVVDALNNAITNKVDKEDGMGLSQESFTTDEKEKLSSLSNYDDTDISNRVTQIETELKSKADDSDIPSLDGYATEKFVTDTVTAIDTGDKNVIESISVNGSIVAPDENKNVTITIPESYDDTEMMESITEIQTSLNSKVDKEEGKSLFSGSYNDLSDKPTIPSIDGLVSEDVLTSTLTNYSTKEYVAEQISAANHLTREIVTEIPTNDTAKSNVVYMYKVESATGSDVYQEYQLINDEVVLIGDTSVDLSNYTNTEDLTELLNDKADKSDIIPLNDSEVTPNNIWSAEKINGMHREMTKAEYDALSDDEKNNGTVYFITDEDADSIIVYDNIQGIPLSKTVGNDGVIEYTVNSDYQQFFDQYVVKEDGKSLSENDYSDIERIKRIHPLGNVNYFNNDIYSALDYTNLNTSTGSVRPYILDLDSILFRNSHPDDFNYKECDFIKKNLWTEFNKVYMFRNMSFNQTPFIEQIRIEDFSNDILTCDFMNKVNYVNYNIFEYATLSFKMTSILPYEEFKQNILPRITTNIVQAKSTFVLQCLPSVDNRFGFVYQIVISGILNYATRPYSMNLTIAGQFNDSCMNIFPAEYEDTMGNVGPDIVEYDKYIDFAIYDLQLQSGFVTEDDFNQGESTNECIPRITSNNYYRQLSIRKEVGFDCAYFIIPTEVSGDTNVNCNISLKINSDEHGVIKNYYHLTGSMGGMYIESLDGIYPSSTFEESDGLIRIQKIKVERIASTESRLYDLYRITAYSDDSNTFELDTFTNNEVDITVSGFFKEIYVFEPMEV